MILSLGSRFREFYLITKTALKVKTLSPLAIQCCHGNRSPTIPVRNRLDYRKVYVKTTCCFHGNRHLTMMKHSIRHCDGQPETSVAMNISTQVVCLAIPPPSCIYPIAWWQFTFLKSKSNYYENINLRHNQAP